jgi:hypothetical protein
LKIPRESKGIDLQKLEYPMVDRARKSLLGRLPTTTKPKREEAHTGAVAMELEDEA